MLRPFRQVDVFTDTPYRGNPVAVVLDGERPDDRGDAALRPLDEPLGDDVRAAPTHPEADYRVRIFTPVAELPFAGHPTLGTCHAWLAAGGAAAAATTSSCRSARPGLCRSAATATGWPSRPRRWCARARWRRRSSTTSPSLLRRRPRRHRGRRVGGQRPGMGGRAAGSAEEVLAVRPAPVDLDVGVVGPLPGGLAGGHRGAGLLPEGRRDGRGPGHRQPQRLAGGVAATTRRVPTPYVASQGTALGRAGRVHIAQERATATHLGGWRHGHLRDAATSICRPRGRLAGGSDARA